MTYHKIRFYEKVKIPNENGCMEWIGQITKAGYGQIKLHGKMVYAHRYAYELWVQPIREALQICHKCDNRICVAPDHLFIGTQLENVADCIKKDRFVKFKRETMCARKLSDENIKIINEKLLNGHSTRKLADEFKVSRGAISHYRRILVKSGLL